MIKGTPYIDLIEKYLRGALSAEESTRFAQLKLNDECFRTQVTLQACLLAHMDAHQKWMLKQELKVMASQLEKKRRPLVHRSLFKWVLGAVILVITSSGMMLTFLDDAIPQSLLDKYLSSHTIHKQEVGKACETEAHYLLQMSHRDQHEQFVANLDAVHQPVFRL